MRILSVETSCDDTAVAILEITGDKKSPVFSVLSNIVSSQTEVHKKYGGVFPTMAKREHQKNIVPVLISALKESHLLKISKESKNIDLKEMLRREPEMEKQLIRFLKKYEKPDIDLVGVTNGPGLDPCLWVGVNFAKALSRYWNIPVVPVNHIESHILVNLLSNKEIEFPAICLIVSGGHTQIILMKAIGKYEILGETRDDAAGECFDKCAKILGLGYPGGPVISNLASKKSSINLPRPMINTKDYDFSFSGLKTAVLYHNRKQKVKSKKYIREMCCEIQQSIIDVLVKKTIKASKDYRAKTIILGGGVSANKELRKQFDNKMKVIAPSPELSTDNALMAAIAGYFHQKKKTDWKNIKANSNLRIS